MNAPATTTRWNPPKMSWWYDAIIDLMTARPDLNKTEIAKEFRVTPQAIYLITNSDIFKARYEQRRAALAGQLDASIHQRLLSVADRSLGLIADVLEKKRDQIPLPQLESLADKMLDRLGYGVKAASPQQSPVVVNLNDNRSVVVPVSPADLDAARLALRRAEGARIVEAHEVRARPLLSTATSNEFESIDPLGAGPPVGGRVEEEDPSTREVE